MRAPTVWKHYKCTWHNSIFAEHTNHCILLAKSKVQARKVINEAYHVVIALTVELIEVS